MDRRGYGYGNEKIQTQQKVINHNYDSMDLDKILKLIEAGNENLEIPVTLKLTPKQFLLLQELRTQEKMDSSEFLRMSFLTTADRVFNKKSEEKVEVPEDKKVKKEQSEKSQFILLALKKYIVSESFSIPTEQEIIEYWPEGAMGKSNVDIMIEVLKKYILALKRKVPTEGELIRLWIEGKKVPAPFFRMRELVVPEKLPGWLAEKLRPVI